MASDATATEATTIESYRQPEVLVGSINYRTWKFSMKMLLEAKDLWDIVSGEEVKPEEGSSLAWDKKAHRAMATIVLAISPLEQEHIIDCATPKEAWDVLGKLYEGKGRNRKFMLLQELFRMSLFDHGEHSSGMAEYLRRIKEKFSELARIGTKLEKDVKVALILNGLPDEYRYLVVAFESQELAATDLDDLSARLLEEETRISLGNDRLRGAMFARKDKKKFPFKCHECGEEGHMRRDCPELSKDKKTANAATAKKGFSM